MAVVINVVLAVTVIALASGAVPEFKLGIADIRTSANGAAVGIRSFG